MILPFGSTVCALLGLGPRTQQQHCIRAILHAIAFRSVQLVETLKKETKIPLKSFSIDGGVSNNGLICEKIATLTRQPLRRPVDIDASARGAAFFAGIGAKIWTTSTLPEIPLKDIVEPVWEDSEILIEEYSHWEDSIKRTLKWSQLEYDSEEPDCFLP
jgi:glycerol kinase